MDLQILESRYERRQHSPLFARIAEEYLAAGRLDEAKRLCLTGIENYPDYVSGRLLLAKCLVADGDLDEAGRIIERVREQYPHSVALKNLLVEWSSKAFVPASAGETDSVLFAPEEKPPEDLRLDQTLGAPPSESSATGLNATDEEPLIVTFPSESELEEGHPESGQRTIARDLHEPVSAEGQVEAFSLEFNKTDDVPIPSSVPDVEGLRESEIMGNPGERPAEAGSSEEADDYFRSMLDDVGDEEVTSDNSGGPEVLSDHTSQVITGGSPDSGFLTAPAPESPSPDFPDSLSVEFLAVEDATGDAEDAAMVMEVPLAEPSERTPGEMVLEETIAGSEHQSSGSNSHDGIQPPVEATPTGMEASDPVGAIAKGSSPAPIAGQEERITSDNIEIPQKDLALDADISSTISISGAPNSAGDIFIPPEFQQVEPPEAPGGRGIRPSRSEGTTGSDEDDESRIVSKTLAQIYESQGEYEEALITYKLLRKRRPEIAGMIDAKIAELAALIEAKLSQ